MAKRTSQLVGADSIDYAPALRGRTASLGWDEFIRREGESKWEEVIRTWEFVDKHKNNMHWVEGAIGHRGDGIPQYLRGRVWPLLAGSSELSLKNREVYQTLVDIPSQGLDDDSEAPAAKITRDLNRTFPNHVDFAEPNGRGQQRLFRVLKAYANLDPETGYCQGMNFVAGYILTVMADENDAFWLFVTIMKKVRSLYMRGLPGFMASLKIFEEILQRHLPTLSAHLEAQGVVPSMYASMWLHTLLAHDIIPETLTARVWDHFVYKGIETLIRVGYALLVLQQETLMGLTDLAILAHFKETEAYQVDAKRVLDTAFSATIDRDILEKIAGVQDLA